MEKGERDWGWERAKYGEGDGKERWSEGGGWEKDGEIEEVGEMGYKGERKSDMRERERESERERENGIGKDREIA